MNFLYIAPDGHVRAGWLTCGRRAGDADGAPILLSRTGDLLGPHDVLALLAPRKPTEDQRAALWRAHRAGFRVETA
jgi:hypothetical protein